MTELEKILLIAIGVQMVVVLVFIAALLDMVNVCLN